MPRAKTQKKAIPIADAATDATDTNGTMLLTIFLKHDQSKTLAEIGKELDQSGFWAAMPPDGVTVESWYVMMGIGQVVTLRLPAAKLREVNLVIERTAWGAFRTEFYPTYDYRAIAERKRRDAGKVNDSPLVSRPNPPRRRGQ